MAAITLALLHAPAHASTTVEFSNNSAITIGDNASASPFPSVINVSGVAPALPTGIRVQLTGFSHGFETDLDILLVGPQNQRSILMSDTGGNSVLSNVTVGFDARALSAVPITGPLVSGSVYRPVNLLTGVDNFPFVLSTSTDAAPADLTAFNLQDPNGVWALYVLDDAGGASGSISGGWSLTFTVPAVFTVNSTADPGDGTCNVSECTLREAVATAGSGDLVRFSALFDAVQIITLINGEMLVNKELTVQGPGADRLTISGNNTSRVFRVGGAGTLALTGLALRDGRAADVGGAVVSDGNLFLRQVEVSNSTAGAGFNGGGLYIAGGAGMVAASSIHDNRASNGAGIEVINADATIDNSTIANNTASGSGGGVRLVSIGGGNAKTLELRQSTLARNVAASGGGLSVVANGGVAASANLRGVLLGDNLGGSLAISGAGAEVVSRRYNLASDGALGALVATGDQVNVNPRLAPLTLNGGTTPSMALLGGSPAIDAGESSAGQFDQRGQFRLFDVPGLPSAASGDGGDIGALEMRPRFVTIAGNSGAGSLRDAITTANGNGSGIDDILFDGSFFNVVRSIDLDTALPDIVGDIAVHGPGANLLTVQRNPAATGKFRVFHVADANAQGAFTGMTIANGLVESVIPNDDFGGGIFSVGRLALAAVRVTGNRTTSGGGVAVLFASAVIDGSTFDGNYAVTQGGAIAFLDNGAHAMRLNNSTISGNQAGTANYGGGIESVGQDGRALLQITNCTIVDNIALIGGGIDTTSFGPTGAGVTTISNTIVAGNSPNNFNAAPDTGGTATITSRGYNLSDDYNGVVAPLGTDKVGAAALGPLVSNGGSVPTRVPAETSPALDAGNGYNTGYDQRGPAFQRAIDLPGIDNAAPPGDRSDIGAVELQALDRVFQDGFE